MERRDKLGNLMPLPVSGPQRAAQDRAKVQAEWEAMDAADNDGLIAETKCARCGVSATIRQNPTCTTRQDIIDRIRREAAAGTWTCRTAACMHGLVRA